MNSLVSPWCSCGNAKFSSSTTSHHCHSRNSCRPLMSPADLHMQCACALDRPQWTLHRGHEWCSGTGELFGQLLQMLLCKILGPWNDFRVEHLACACRSLLGVVIPPRHLLFAYVYGWSNIIASASPTFVQFRQFSYSSECKHTAHRITSYHINNAPQRMIYACKWLSLNSAISCCSVFVIIFACWESFCFSSQI